MKLCSRPVGRPVAEHAITPTREVEGDPTGGFGQLEAHRGRRTNDHRRLDPERAAVLGHHEFAEAVNASQVAAGHVGAKQRDLLRRQPEVGLVVGIRGAPDGRRGSGGDRSLGQRGRGVGGHLASPFLSLRGASGFRHREQFGESARVRISARQDGHRHACSGGSAIVAPTVVLAGAISSREDLMPAAPRARDRSGVAGSRGRCCTRRGGGHTPPRLRCCLCGSSRRRARPDVPRRPAGRA